MAFKTVHVENIGEVTLRKNKRSKNVSISIRPSKGVSVTIPYFLSYKYGLKILEQKRNWVEKHLPKIKAYQQNKIIFTDESHFKTLYRTLSISSHPSHKIKTTIDEQTIRIFYPETIPVQNQEIQDIITQTIIKTLRKRLLKNSGLNTTRYLLKIIKPYGEVVVVKIILT